MSDGWRKVAFAGDCDEDDGGELVCSECGGDYSQCDCPGPTMDEYEYKFDENGVMWARRLSDASPV